MEKILQKETHYDTIKDLASKHSLKEISKILGIGSTTVCEFINENGIVLKSKQKHTFLTDNLGNIVEDSYRLRISKLSKKYNVSVAKMWRFMAEHDILSFEKRKEIRIREYLEQNPVGNSLPELAKMFDSHRSVIERIVEELGITLIENFYLSSKDHEIREVLSKFHVSEAARVLNLNSTSLAQYAKKNGIETVQFPVKDKLPGHIVYAYYDKDGIIRYYGEGCSEDRAYHVTGHPSKGYTKYFSDYAPTVKILHYGLSKDEALKIEHDLIAENLSTVCTVYNHPKSSRKKKPISFDEMNNLLYVDSTSPSGLRWKEGVESYGNRKANTVAGSRGSKGYWSVNFAGKSSVRTHCIVWLLCNKSIDLDKAIDHIDNDRDNNSIDNLREVTHSENNKNRRTNSNTGYKNIYWNERDNRYIVTYVDGDKRLVSSFGAVKLGSKENALNAALEFRRELITKGIVVIPKESN